MIKKLYNHPNRVMLVYEAQPISRRERHHRVSPLPIGWRVTRRTDWLCRSVIKLCGVVDSFQDTGWTRAQHGLFSHAKLCCRSSWTPIQLNISSTSAIAPSRKSTLMTIDGEITSDGQIELENLSIVHQPCPSGKKRCRRWTDLFIEYIDLVPKRRLIRKTPEGKITFPTLYFDEELLFVCLQLSKHLILERFDRWIAKLFQGTIATSNKICAVGRKVKVSLSIGFVNNQPRTISLVSLVHPLIIPTAMPLGTMSPAECNSQLPPFKTSISQLWSVHVYPTMLPVRCVSTGGIWCMVQTTPKWTCI